MNPLLRQLVREIEYLRGKVYYDPVTGLLGRHWLDENLPEWKGYVILADLDSFKEVNDTYGYQVGDDILREFASFLLTNTRQSSGRERDVVTSPACRRGGDEFMILVRDHTMAVSLSGRLRRWEGRYGVTVSCGIGETERIANDRLHIEKRKKHER